VTAVKKADFIASFTASGLTYSQAEKAYDAMIKCVENGVADKRGIVFGHVGALKPKQLKPRRVVMGCLVGPGGAVSRKKREYLLGTRLCYRWSLFQTFGRRHNLVP